MVTTLTPQIEMNRIWSQASEPQIESIIAGLTASLNRGVGAIGKNSRPYTYGLDRFTPTAELAEERVVIHELAASDFSDGWDFQSFNQLLDWAVAMHQDLQESPEGCEASVHAHGYYDESGTLVPVRTVRVHERSDWSAVTSAWNGTVRQSDACPSYQVEVVACDGRATLSELQGELIFS